ncbi:unnamed protein product, partial [Didymodactylos carnosus]
FHSRILSYDYTTQQDSGVDVNSEMSTNFTSGLITQKEDVIKKTHQVIVSTDLFNLSDDSLHSDNKQCINKLDVMTKLLRPSYFLRRSLKSEQQSDDDMKSYSTAICEKNHTNTFSDVYYSADSELNMSTTTEHSSMSIEDNDKENEDCQHHLTNDKITITPITEQNTYTGFIGIEDIENSSDDDNNVETKSLELVSSPIITDPEKFAFHFD